MFCNFKWLMFLINYAFRIAGTKLRKINETTKYFGNYLC